MVRQLTSRLLCLALAAGLFGVLPVRHARAATCTSTQSGNWNNPATWSCGAVPGGADDVVILPEHQVTLAQDESVNNIAIGNGPERLRGGYVLSVYGTLNSTSTSPNANLISPSTTIRFVGSTNRNLFVSPWGATTTGLVFEVALDAGTIGTSSTNVKARVIRVTSGTLQMSTSLRPDAGTSGTGVLEIGPGGTLVVAGPLSRTSDVNTPFQSFTNSGKFKTSATNTAWASATPCSFAADSTVEYSGSNQTIQVPLGSGYGNLILSGSGAKTAAGDIEVKGNFTNQSALFAPATHTVTFSGSSEQTIGGSAVTAFNNLTVAPGATVTIPAANQPTVAGALANHGTLKQTRDVSVNTAFLHISNGATPPVATYRGVDVVTADNLGSTTVAVSGNQASCPNALGFPARRCYTISPANAGSASLTFYLTPAELQVGQSPNTLNIWRWTGAGTVWTELTKSGSDSTCTNASNCYVTGTGITAFGEFVLKNNDPTSVTLAEFFAEQVADTVLLTWETASELNNVGFNLYRGTSPAAPDRQLNDLLIPSQSLGNPGGFTYTWEDRADLVPGTTYFYWVEDVDTNSVATRHGPVSVDFVAPAAVTLSGVDAGPAVVAGSDIPLAGMLLALLASLAGALTMRRYSA